MKNNMDFLKDTLQIFKQGYYEKNDRKIELKLSKAEIEKATVFLPNEVNAFKTKTPDDQIFVMGRCGFSCENLDSYSMAHKTQELKNFLETKPCKEVLVLNFANPVNPGGGVRRGANAQEEDLCRSSSLLLSIESKTAQKYYDYNKSLNTYMGSDAIIISPKVEIIRDKTGGLLDETLVVAVMTCAAPMITYGIEDMTEEQYQEMFYNRIIGMLSCAAQLGYKYLVLGAFGCGAFRNDAKLVSDLFYKALKDFEIDRMTTKDFFRRIDFAVLDRSESKYNFNEFYRNFGGDNFYRAEKEAELKKIKANIKKKEVYLDKIKGSLFGGAIGDALGYPVEFMSIQEIQGQYGSEGICEYELDKQTGQALISDDTQMTLFTANGILVGDTRLCMRGIGGQPIMYLPKSYIDWLTTQTTSFDTRSNTKRFNESGGISWLLDVPELYSRRAPGNTCISALLSLKNEMWHDNFIENPMNDSKGCGAIMRIAPLGLYYSPDAVNISDIDMEAAHVSAITHGHSLGYMTSSVLTHILNRIVYPQKNINTLEKIVKDARDTVIRLFKGDKHIKELKNIIDLSIKLSKNNKSDIENIAAIGEGWVAEETLAIAIYCSLRYQNDFSKAVIAAVNHSGDSDSTGAVTGNIVGALVGYENIEEKWKANLELADVIDEMAIDLCHGCNMDEYSDYRDDDWVRKYMNMHWKENNTNDNYKDINSIVSSSAIDEINRFLRNGGI